MVQDAPAPDIVFTTQLVSDTVSLPCRYLGKGVEQVAADRLMAKYHGNCSKYGYVKTNSVKILRVHDIRIDMSSLNATLKVPIDFTMETFNPMEGSILLGKVRNINPDAGILVVIIHDDHDVMSVIVPKRIASIKSNMDLDTVFIGMRAKVKIIKRQIQVGEDTLFAIGAIVSNPNDINPLPPDVEVVADDAAALLVDNADDQSIVGVVESDSDTEEAKSEGTIVFDEDLSESASDEEECEDGECDDPVDNTDAVSEKSE
jgi:DNA-directed RNA polymerase subunit E'/Rpb7